MKPQDRTRAILRSGLTSTQRLVLIALADYCDQHGECWPSQTTLAKNTGYSKRTVGKTIRSLVDAGILRVEGERSQCKVFRLEAKQIPPYEEPTSPHPRSRFPTPPKQVQGVNEVPTPPEAGSPPPGNVVPTEATKEATKEATTFCAATAAPTEWTAFISLFNEHHSKARPKHTDKVGKAGATTLGSRLKALIKGEEHAMAVWTWLLTSSHLDAQWWRKARVGRKLVLSFLVMNNYRMLEASYLAEVEEGDTGEVKRETREQREDREREEARDRFEKQHQVGKYRPRVLEGGKQ